MTNLTNKFNMTAEAVCDIEWLGIEQLNQKTLKSEMERYITYRPPKRDYFNCDYTDDNIEPKLKLFIHKGDRIGLIQHWDLQGICYAEDWTEDVEDETREWLNTKIKDIPDEIDWVVSDRVKEILLKTKEWKWTKVLREVQNAFKHKRDKEAATTVALLQRGLFDR